jgi:hypothetical protein
VDIWSKPRTWVVLGVSAVGVFLLYQLWVWEVERVEVPANHFLVKINLWGKDLPEGEIVAPDSSWKGVQREVLTEGRHFLNPLLYSYEKHEAVKVPNGQCAVLTRKAGKPISPERLLQGEYLAKGEFGDPDGERGVVEKPLGPGKHYINPYLYSWTLENAVKVGATQVGVRTLRWGKDPKVLPGRKTPYVVPDGYRGVQEDLVPPGDKYINKHVEWIEPVDVSTHQVEFKDIWFFSRDGFKVQPHVRVSYKVIPKKAPELFVMLCDKGKLNQEDATPEQQAKNPILQKFVLPLIRGYVRIEGSKYDARDYVSQQKESKTSVNPRELLEKELKEKVMPQCEAVGVMIESLAVNQLELNNDLKDLAGLIADRQQAHAQRLTNARLIDQHKQEQEQKATEILAKQRQLVVDANAQLEVAKTDAKRDLAVEEAKLKTALKAAQARLDGARETAKLAIVKGKGEAASVMAENEAEVAGLKTAIGGFPSPDHFAQYHVLTKVAPALSEIFASDTSEFARVFSTYMSSGRKLGAASLPLPRTESRVDAKGGGK